MTRTLIDDCFRPSQAKLSHAEAIQTLKNAVLPLPAVVEIGIGDALGRILTQDAVATEPVPAHTNAAVDGYAFAASPQSHMSGAVLPVIGRAAAGHPAAEPASAEAATRIFTGAVMPRGLDTVVMQEDVQRTERDGVAFVSIPAGVKPGANVRKAGEDVQAGTSLYRSSDRLRPHDLAALASIGIGRVRCYDRLRVAIVSTGDEVLTAGSARLQPGQVYDANTPMLTALVGSSGAAVESLGIWPDNRDVVTANLAAAAKNYDVILTSGGASLGEEDHMAAALTALGKRHLWQLAIKPGRPMMFGQISSGTRNTIVVGLPGNPVAVFVCFLMYVYPLLRAAGGGAWPEPRRFMLPAAFDFAGRKTGRREFWRGRMVQTSSATVVEKFPRDGSGLISGLRWSNGLIDIPEDHGDIARNDPVAFIPYSEFGF